MRTPPPQLPDPPPDPPSPSQLPPFPDPPALAGPVPSGPVPSPPAPSRPVPMVPAPPRPAPSPLLVGLPTRVPLPAAGPAFDDQANLDLSPPPTSASPPPAAPGPDSTPTGPGRGDAEPALAEPADVPSGPPPARAAPPAPPARPDGPDTGAWASMFAQALAEALAGSRPARQIAPWTTEQARRRIQALGPLLQDGPRPVVRRVLTSAPRRDVVEMTVVIGVGPRTRAIAVRLERARPSSARPGRGRPWICTAIEAA
jgi:hypothetical protein